MPRHRRESHDRPATRRSAGHAADRPGPAGDRAAVHREDSKGLVNRVFPQIEDLLGLGGMIGRELNGDLGQRLRRGRYGCHRIAVASVTVR